MSRATRQAKRRLRRRINRVEARLKLTRAELKALTDVDANDLRGRMRKLVTQALEANVAFLADADLDDDGELDFEELVEAVRDWADEQIELDGLAELASDVGLFVVSRVAVAIYNGTEQRLARREARDEALLRRLRQRLAA